MSSTWWRKWKEPSVWGTLIVVSLTWAALSELDGLDRDLPIFRNLARFIADFFPPDWSVWPEIFEGLKESFAMAWLATSIAFIVALPLGSLASRSVMPLWVSLVGRFVLNAIRTIPSLIWALLAVAVMGPSEFAGVMALVFYSLGYLGKFFCDDFDSIEKKNFAALRQIGTQRSLAFRYGLWPQLRPRFGSHYLWMLEYNIRASAIIGYVGAGGIGTQLFIYQEFYQWNRFSTALLSILIVVILLDGLSQKVQAYFRDSEKSIAQTRL